MATLGQQNGQGVDPQDSLDALEVLVPSVMTHGALMQRTITSKFIETINKEVKRLLTWTFVLPGVQVKDADDSAQVLRHDALSSDADAGHASIDMRQMVQHPGGRDWRGPTRISNASFNSRRRREKVKH